MIERQVVFPTDIERIDEMLSRENANSIIGLARMASVDRPLPARKLLAELESFSDPKQTETALFLARSTFQAMDYLGAEPEIVGFASTRTVENGLHIENLFVHPTSRNRGIGRQLVKTCVELAEDQRAQFVQVTNKQVSEAAHQLFSAMEFQSGEENLPRLRLNK